MPILMTLRMRLPVWPRQAPERMRVENSAIASSTWCTSGTTSWPSTRMRASFGARSATCSTARCSVILIFSPLNIASRRSATPRSCRELQQQPHRLVGDAVLRIVEIKPGAFGRQAFAAARVLREELAQMHVS